MIVSRFTFALRNPNLNQRCRRHWAASVRKERVKVVLHKPSYDVLEKRVSQWKTFLAKESEAILTRGEEEPVQRVLLSLDRIWREPTEGLLMEFSLGKVFEPSQSAFSHFGIFKTGVHIKLVPSKKGVQQEIEGVIIGIDDGELKVRLKKTVNDIIINTREIGAIKKWEMTLGSLDPNKRILEMLHSKLLKKTPGYDTLKKTLKIGSLDVHSTYRRRNIQFGNKLNESQKNAVNAVVNSQQEFVAIHGPPGTGKTRVIAEIVYQLLRDKRKSKIVVCAPSNKAVDNALIACLKRGVDESLCLRLGFATEEIRNCTSTHISSMLKQHIFYDDLSEFVQRRDKYEEEESENTRRKLNDLRRRSMALEFYMKRTILRDVNVIFSTVSCANLYLFIENHRFKPDLIIMDEAAQITEPNSWEVLLQAERFVVVGDHCQLGPLLHSKENLATDVMQQSDGINNDVSKSLLERLLNHFKGKKHYVHLLDVNYRSHWLIQHWSNEQFYDNKLKADESVKHSQLDDMPAVKAAIDRNDDTDNSSEQKALITDPLVLVDTALTTSVDLAELNEYYPGRNINFFDSKEKNAHSYYNTGEALCAAYQLLALREGGLESSDIGCITPYIAQAKHIKEFLGVNDIDVSSVDSFQGQQREAIVMSFVRNNHANVIGFLGNLRRMNVSITRAKRQFFLIASSNALKRNPALGDLYRLIQRFGTVINPKELLLNGYWQLKLRSDKNANERAVRRRIS